MLPSVKRNDVWAPLGQTKEDHPPWVSLSGRVVGNHANNHLRTTQSCEMTEWHFVLVACTLASKVLKLKMVGIGLSATSRDLG